MTLDRVNYLNIGLMLISLAAAIVLPFEVFLLAYAVLGPLHYLTEISWLHDRQYFSPRKLDWIPIAVLGLLMLLGARSIMGKEIYDFFVGLGLKQPMAFLSAYGYNITFLAFGLALIFVAFKEWPHRIAAMIVLALCAYLFMLPDPIVSDAPISNEAYMRKVVEPYDAKWHSPVFKIFGVYVPTLIHVYLFTGAFILFGAMKSRSTSGYISFAVFILCAAACFLLAPSYGGIMASEWAQANYGNTFSQLSMHLLDDFGGAKYDQMLLQNAFGGPEGKAATNTMIFSHQLSILFARFIAFAYTYHYLNWFSKTSVIKWHAVPKWRFALVIIAWVASVALYFADYEYGFRWLFLLSFLHVMLEFPLNHQSFIGIGREFRGMLGGKRPASTAKAG